MLIFISNSFLFLESLILISFLYDGWFGSFLVRGGYMGGCGVSANVNFLLATTFCSSNLWSCEVLESSIAIFLEVLFFETRYNGLRYWKVELFSNNLRKVNYSSEWDCYMNISKFALCTIHFWEGSWHGLSPNFLLF